jgi:phosphoglycerate dehydrogenase-like enzyme
VPEVLYIVQRGNEEPWLTDFAAAAEGRLEVRLLDHDRPLEPQFAGIEVVIDQGGHATREMIDVGAAAGVRLWQVVGTGLDHSEVEHTLGRGIAMANTPGQFSSIALAEHALMFILALSKRLREAERNCREGRMWQPMSDELAGQVLGLVGFGASARELARRASPLGLRVRAVDVVAPQPGILDALGVEHFDGVEALDELLAGSDFVSLHVPLMASTRHLIDARRLRLMKPSAYLVNVARGRIVDEEALVEVLRDGTIAGAGIDVFGEEPLTPANPILHLPNVITTPHTAGVTGGTSRRRAEAAVLNALRAFDGEPLEHLVLAA